CAAAVRLNDVREVRAARRRDPGTRRAQVAAGCAARASRAARSDGDRVRGVRDDGYEFLRNCACAAASAASVRCRSSVRAAAAAPAAGADRANTNTPDTVGANPGAAGGELNVVAAREVVAARRGVRQTGRVSHGDAAAAAPEV